MAAFFLGYRIRGRSKTLAALSAACFFNGLIFSSSLSRFPLDQKIFFVFPEMARKSKPVKLSWALFSQQRPNETMLGTRTWAQLAIFRSAVQRRFLFIIIKIEFSIHFLQDVPKRILIFTEFRACINAGTQFNNGCVETTGLEHPLLESLDLAVIFYF